MQRLIEKLRARPDSHKHGIALGVSFAVTLVIAFIWMSVVLPGLFSNSNSKSVVTAQNANSQKSQSFRDSLTKPGPIATFRRNVAQTFEAVKGQWNFIGNYIKQTEYDAELESQAELQVLSPEERDAELKGQNTATNNANSATFQDRNLVQ